MNNPNNCETLKGRNTLVATTDLIAAAQQNEAKKIQFALKKIRKCAISRTHLDV